MSVEVIARLCHAQKPIDSFQTFVGLRIIVMDPKGRGMGYQNVERATVLKPVQYQTRQQAKGPQIGFGLGVLVGAMWPIADRASEAPNQEFFDAHHFQVQIRAAFRIGKSFSIFIVRIMIARYIEQRYVQKGEQIFKVLIGQIAATQHQIDLAEMPSITQAVEALDHFIA